MASSTVPKVAGPTPQPVTRRDTKAEQFRARIRYLDTAIEEERKKNTANGKHTSRALRNLAAEQNRLAYKLNKLRPK